MEHARPARRTASVQSGPAPHRSARVLTFLMALAAASSFALLLLGRHAGRPARAELAFGLFNVPVAPTFASAALLALVTRALLGRKRIGLTAVAAFQLAGIYVGVGELVPAARLPFSEVWTSRGDLGQGLDVAAMVVGTSLLWWLWRLRPAFTGRLQPGSWGAALAVLAVGSGLTFALTWLLLGRSGRGQVGAVVATVLAAFGGISRHALVGVPSYVVDLAAIVAGVTILGAAALFLASARPGNRWSPDREVRIRALLAKHGAGDSLGYFATRRDKASVFAPNGRAAITYRVLAGVSLASGDPIGEADSWPEAIAAWRTEAREFGWLPAVLGASETAARAYAAAGLRVILMGDEAILDPDRFDLRRASMAPVRHAVKRARRAGVTVRIRRQAELTGTEVDMLATDVASWRGDERERGFSMALGRTGDPADDQVLHVTAHGRDGAVVGLLTFVPWGRAGVSLDLMRRDPAAPNGVTELMVAELLARARQLGIKRVSLNFCLFRGVFADSARIGARSTTRLNASVLGVLDRFWQLERLYRSNAKYEPSWHPRFLCYDDAISLPQVLLASGAAEGFLPWPARQGATESTLDGDHLRHMRLAVARARGQADSTSLDRRRRGQFGHRVARLELMRSEGLEAYPAGGGQPTTSVRELAEWLPLTTEQAVPAVPAVPAGSPDVAASLTRLTAGSLSPVLATRDAPPLGNPECARSTRTLTPISVVGRVRDLRNHGSVVFATIVDGGAAVQVILEPGTSGPARAVRDFARFVDRGDLVRFEGAVGASRNGTPSLLVRSWRMEGKCLHPLPFRALTSPEARLRQRSADLVVHPESVDLFRARSAVVASVRSTLAADGFTEVETPMLHAVHGGATARPFRTFSNAHGLDLSLRIAPELHLKRLLVGGLGPIFELGRNFRNEGWDATHNPEFTSLEVYRPHVDYTAMRLLAERIVKAAACSVHGREVLPLPRDGQVRTGLAGVELVDVSGPWPVVQVIDAVSSAVGSPVALDTDPDLLIRIAHRHGIEVRPDMGPGSILEELYATLVEPATTVPTFYVDFPRETSPLTRPHRSSPGLVERWDLVIAGMELGTAYSELTDPIDQRRRLVEQSRRAAAGDPEAMEVDEDFLLALEQGMPPSGGLGIGIDRLVMLVTNASIRQVLTFPFVRPLNPVDTHGDGAR